MSSNGSASFGIKALVAKTQDSLVEKTIGKSIQVREVHGDVFDLGNNTLKNKCKCFQDPQESRTTLLQEGENDMNLKEGISVTLHDTNHVKEGSIKKREGFKRLQDVFGAHINIMVVQDTNNTRKRQKSS